MAATKPPASVCTNKIETFIIRSVSSSVTVSASLRTFPVFLKRKEIDSTPKPLVFAANFRNIVGF